MFWLSVCWPNTPPGHGHRQAGDLGLVESVPVSSGGCFPFVLFCRPILDTRGSLPGARISVQTYSVDPTVLLTSAAYSLAHDC